MKDKIEVRVYVVNEISRLRMLFEKIARTINQLFCLHLYTRMEVTIRERVITCNRCGKRL